MILEFGGYNSVHGDTSTTFAAALAAFIIRWQSAMSKPGLEQITIFSISEEMNRQMVDRLADMYFAPTELNKRICFAENIPDEKYLLQATLL